MQRVLVKSLSREEIDSLKNERVIRLAKRMQRHKPSVRFWDKLFLGHAIKRENRLIGELEAECELLKSAKKGVAEVRIVHDIVETKGEINANVVNSVIGVLLGSFAAKLAYDFGCIALRVSSIQDVLLGVGAAALGIFSLRNLFLAVSDGAKALSHYLWRMKVYGLKRAAELFQGLTEDSSYLSALLEFAEEAGKIPSMPLADERVRLKWNQCVDGIAGILGKTIAANMENEAMVRSGYRELLLKLEEKRRTKA